MDTRCLLAAAAVQALASAPLGIYRDASMDLLCLLSASTVHAKASRDPRCIVASNAVRAHAFKDTRCMLTTGAVLAWASKDIRCILTCNAGSKPVPPRTPMHPVRQHGPQLGL